MNGYERVFALFFAPGEITEIRALGLTGKSQHYEGYVGKKSVVSGYFDNAKDFAKAAKNLDAGHAKGVYFILNPADVALFARGPNRLIASPDATTTDKGITCVRWLYIDIDPERPGGVSSTNKEMEQAAELAKDIAEWLEKGKLGFARGIRAWSGNGYHLLYRLPDLKNNQDTSKLIRGALKAIEFQFRNPKIIIDLQVHNPARMAKLYGTYARKGYSTKDRPHRKSQLFPEQPEKLEDVGVTPLERLKKLADMAPAEDQYPVPAVNAAQAKGGATADGKVQKMTNNLGTLDMERYLQQYQVQYSVKQDGLRTIYQLDQCLFNPDHGKNQASIIQSAGPPYLSYQCFHNSCKDYRWKDARAKISGADSIAPFYSNYDPNWNPATAGGSTGLLANVGIKSCAVEGTEKNGVPGPLEINPAEFFERRGKRPSFVPRLMANYFLKYMQHIVYTDGVFWRYADGVWKQFPKDMLAHIATLALGDLADSARIDNSIKIFQGLVSIREEQWGHDDQYINCQNGMVNLKTGKLLPHAPQYGSKIQIQAKFDYDAKCDRWLGFLDEVFPEDRKSKEKEGKKSELLRQFFGYCLLPDCRFQKGMFLYGAGSNGKSTALNVLIDIVGRENTSSLTINDLSQRFKVQFLENKLVNVATETNSRDPIGTEIYKAALRGEPITAERKYGEPYLFNPTAKWLVAMNEPPTIPDKSYGFTRSVIVLNFTRRFAKKEIDSSLGEALEKEKDGIFMWALFGLKIILRNNGFEIPQVVEEQGEEFMKSLNPLLIYIEERCKIGAKEQVTSVSLYKDYKQWCVDASNRPLSRNKFINQLYMNFPGITKDNHINDGISDHRGFAGIGLNAGPTLAEQEDDNAGG